MTFPRTRRVAAAAAVAAVVAALAFSPQATAAPAPAPAPAGAEVEPQLASHSEQRLDSAKAALDRAAPPDESITSWYVDADAHAVVVAAQPDAGPAVARFIEASGVDKELVRVEPATGAPRLLQPWPLTEGDPYYVGSARCTVGFLVTTRGGDDGFVTAGHCGGVGSSTQGFNLQPQGTFQISHFPGNDWALVIVSDNWIPTPIATGSREAAVGASVCKLGSTTGTTCGTITAKNVTVNYPQGTVSGLTRTTLCAEPGDSGGPVFAGTQGQGIVSGGSGNCAFGGVTYFQPLNPILSSARLSLITA